MNIAPYWARARLGDFFGWGWSFTSQEEAQERAKQTAARNVQRHAEGTLGGESDWYYADRPMREPILREFRDDTGALQALVTRNSQGCLVLNTSGALFVDVDFAPESKPAPAPKPWGGFLGLFAKKPPPPPPPPPTPASPEAHVAAQAEAWTRNHPDWNWRVYRTKAGMRLLATQAVFGPNDDIVEQAFQALDADTLYRRLCHSQQCFRARLTPKPWRCGMAACPAKWPCQSDRETRDFQAWTDLYMRQSARFATCRFITEIGSGAVAQELAPLVAFHDKATLCDQDLPLA